jgi:hypothetical protein
MYTLPVFTFNEEYKSYGLASYMLSFLEENLAPGEGYAFNLYAKKILANQFNCQYENPSSGDALIHYLDFDREEDRTFFLLRFA